MYCVVVVGAGVVVVVAYKLLSKVALIKLHIRSKVDENPEILNYAIYLMLIGSIALLP